ncbi:MAG: F0F1 ATP synthase subunit epsilon [Planctomycetota bacterium]
MKLRILLPSEILLERDVVKVVAEGCRGLFCLLPRHIDYVSSLVPGILSWTLADGTEQHAAVDRGVLVKVASHVDVSVGHAIVGPALGELRQRVDHEFAVLDDRERAARTATARLEASLVRRFLQLGG